MTAAEKVKAFFGVQDMTVGKPMRVLLQFSIPLLIGNFAQQLYNTVDSIIVGKYIGDTALAAVGSAGPVINLLLVLFMGISTGASILSAQYFGAKDRKNLSHVVGSSIFLTILSGVLMMIVGYFLSPWLVSLLAPPAEVADGCVVYLQVIFLGIVGGAAYNILSGVMRGLGDSVYPLLFLVLASLINIVLDIVFVSRLNMGIAGVAWATIIAQGISGTLCVVRLCRMRDVVDVNRTTLKPHKQLVLRLCKLGMPAGITQAIFSMASILVQGLTNSLGTAVIAANVAIMRVDGFAMMPNFTFGIAATTYIGQNVGAQRSDRIRSGIRELMKLALGTAFVLVACLLLFGYNLIELFSSTPAVIEIGQKGLQWLAFGYICFAVTQVLQGVMRGAGETMIPMYISVITTVVLRMPLAYLIAALTRSETWPNGHPYCLFASLLIAWIIGMILSLTVYRTGWWKRRLSEQMQKEI